MADNPTPSAFEALIRSWTTQQLRNLDIISSNRDTKLNTSNLRSNDTPSQQTILGAPGQISVGRDFGKMDFVGPLHSHAGKGTVVPMTTDKYNVYSVSESQIPNPHRRGRCTNFGGSNDPSDKGETISGPKTKKLNVHQGLWVALGTGSAHAPRNTQGEIGAYFGDYVAIRNPKNGLTVIGVVVDEGPASPSRVADCAIGLLQAIGISGGDGIVDIWKVQK